MTFGTLIMCFVAAVGSAPTGNGIVKGWWYIFINTFNYYLIKLLFFSLSGSSIGYNVHSWISLDFHKLNKFFSLSKVVDTFLL